MSFKYCSLETERTCKVTRTWVKLIATLHTVFKGQSKQDVDGSHAARFCSDRGCKSPIQSLFAHHTLFVVCT